MLVEGILAHSVEQGDFLMLLSAEVTNGMITESILKLDLINDFLRKELLVTRDLIDLRLVIKPVRLLRVECLDNAFIPVKVSLIAILRRCLWLFKNVLSHIPAVRN